MNDDFKRVLYVGLIPLVLSMWVMFNDPSHWVPALLYIVAIMAGLNLLYFKANG